MNRVYLAAADPEEHSSLRQLLLDQHVDVVGEAVDWATTFAQVPVSCIDKLVIDWDLLPNPPNAALDALRKACPTNLVIVLISQLDAGRQAALSAGTDEFISKAEMPERVVERLRLAAASILIQPNI